MAPYLPHSGTPTLCQKLDRCYLLIKPNQNTITGLVQNIHFHESAVGATLGMHRDSRSFSLIRRLSIFPTKTIQFPPPCAGSFIEYPDHRPAQSSIILNPTSTNTHFLIPFFTSLRLGESLFMGSVDNATEGNKKDRLPAEAKKILQSLASGWDDIIDSNALQVIPLKGAMTNEVYQIKWPTNTNRSRKVLVRIYGEGVEVFFDRENEIQTFEFMSKKGQGPRLLGRFSNGRIEEFIRARTLSAPDMRDPEISALIATKTKEFHNLVMPGPKTVLLWDRLRNWLSAAKSMSSPEEAKAFRLDSIEQEIYELENSLCGDQRIGFCHNDLQYGNIMIDEETRLITIIDYEYACYNPVAFDIANHFCEMAADYHTETPHLLDYNKYPDYNERQRFLHVYLSCSGEEPSDLEIEHLVQEVEKYALASHLFWGLWGFISEHVNEIDFDYMEYARQRFQQYWLRKPELLGSFTDAVANDK